MSDTRFKLVHHFMPDDSSVADLRTLPLVPNVAAFESFLRTAKTGSRSVALSSLDYAQLEIEKLSVIVDAMTDCLRHHRAELPRECCGGCTTAACVDGRTFTVPAERSR